MAIALVSGGMDSLLSGAIALEKHSTVAFLHLSYGQKTASKERACFEKIALHYQIPSHLQRIVVAPFLQQIGGSSLTDQSISVKKGHLPKRGEIPDSYVPFRNTHLLAMAVSWAETIGAKAIYIGAVEEDSSGYPDCRQSYYQAFNKLIEQGTKEGNIRVIAPIISLDKVAIIKKARELNAPLHLTWSCYGEEELACGSCDSCTLRLNAFKKAQIKDPIPYR